MRVACVVVVLCGCGVPPVVAIDALDPAFGTDGRTLLSFKDCPGSMVSLQDIAKTRNGFVAVGTACRGWLLVGYTADGRVDPGFGTAGKTQLFASDSNGGSDYLATEVWELADGKLLVAGRIRGGMRMRHFSATGQADPAFDQAFDATLNAQFPYGFVSAVQPDGKVIAALSEKVMRMHPDGSRDLSFGTNGVASLTWSGEGTFVNSVHVRPDGTIALIGYDPSVKPTAHFVAVLTAEGALDPAFGTQGVFVLPTADKGENQVEAAAIDATGAVLLAGCDVGGGFYVPAVWRLTPAGALDPAFGTVGRAEGATIAQSGRFVAVAPLPDGRVVAAGRGRTGGSGDPSWVVSRLTAGGRPDPTFHGKGAVLFDLEIPALSSGVVAVVPDSQGYVIGGIAFPESGGPNSIFSAGSFAVARVSL